VHAPALFRAVRWPHAIGFGRRTTVAALNKLTQAADQCELMDSSEEVRSGHLAEGEVTLGPRDDAASSLAKELDTRSHSNS
jgi:hypothetical protein